jgi:uncharacterized protein with HEPN domain
VSSSKRKWKFRLRHIIEAIGKIEQYTAEISFEKFAADSKTFDAVIRNLTIIGEAARQVPSEIETAFPQVPWAEMRAVRNILTTSMTALMLVSSGIPSVMTYRRWYQCSIRCCARLLSEFTQ